MSVGSSSQTNPKILKNFVSLYYEDQIVHSNEQVSNTTTTCNKHHDMKKNNNEVLVITCSNNIEGYILSPDSIWQFVNTQGNSIYRRH